MTKQLKICEKGHRFYKSSDCPVCPICALEQKPKSGFLSKLSAPARRALEWEGIFTVEKLSTYSKKEILGLHGMGPKQYSKIGKRIESKRIYI